MGDEPCALERYTANLRNDCDPAAHLPKLAQQQDYRANRKVAELATAGRLPHGISGVAPQDQGGIPKAVVILGAGTGRANGVYKAAPKEECGAPAYEHFALGPTLRLVRTPHTSKKTGHTKHGWLLGERGAPLYGAPTEALKVPSSGWKEFGGAPPMPTVVAYGRLADAFFALADHERRLGEAASECEHLQDACAAFTAGLDALDRSGDRFGEPFEGRATLLLSRRAGVSLRLGEFRPALRDAVAAAELTPGDAASLAAAAEAASSLGCEDDSAAERLLGELGRGQILDRGAPLALGIVEKWIDGLIAPKGPSWRDYRQSSELWTDSYRRRCFY